MQQTTFIKEKINRPIKISLISPIKPVIVTKTPTKIAPSIISPLITKPIPQVKPKPKKIIKKRKLKKKPKKIIHKKVVHKKKIHKKKIVKKKSVKRKKPIHKKRVKKKIVKKKKVIKKHYSTLVEDDYTPPSTLVDNRPIIEEYFEPTPVIAKPVVPKRIVTPPRPKVNKSAAIARFKSALRNTINGHKRYPRMARRRHIEGSVTVKFNISSSGQVNNIRFIRGKRILQKGARKAVLSSFPQSIPFNIRDHFPMNNVVLTMHFNLN